jgi:hypothetical protein
VLLEASGDYREADLEEIALAGWQLGCTHWTTPKKDADTGILQHFTLAETSSNTSPLLKRGSHADTPCVVLRRDLE